MIDKEKWSTLRQVVDVLEKAMKDEWSWSINQECKYVELKIDMRGHSCRIIDRNGKDISVEELKYQVPQAKD
jgi:hypothetical protein